MNSGSERAAPADVQAQLSANRTGRLAIIDGLRGVASMLVVLFHLGEAAELYTVPIVGFIMLHGNMGVEVFFVISGFVIAYSVRNAEHTPRFLGRFALRRSIRLDPPYWVAIAAEIVLIKVGLILFADHKVPLPSVGDVIAHLFYLQGLLRIKHIVPIFWTLCYEVQFYLALVTTLVAVHAITKRVPTLNKRRILITIGVASFVYSAAIDAELLKYPLEGLFVDRWYQFCLGIITLAVASRWVPAYCLWGAWLVIGTFLVIGPTTAYTAQSALTCVGTSMVIILSMRFVAITRTAELGVIQFLGRISYSLYLIHNVVGWRFVSVARRLLPHDQSVLVRGAVFLAGVGVSVGAAYLMYLLIEKPSLRLASRISVSGRTAA